VGEEEDAPLDRSPLHSFSEEGERFLRFIFPLLLKKGKKKK